MNSNQYDVLLEELRKSRGGIGPTIVDNIKDEFPKGDDFVDACRDAYFDKDTEELEQIDGIGRGYALWKLADFVKMFYEWSGGDAETIEVDAMSGEEFFKQH